MSTHRLCCCQTNSGQPQLVRGGWYHFLVMNDDHSVSVLIGKLQQNKFADVMGYSNCYETSAADRCLTDCVPIEAPATHPLAVPAGVKSTAEGSTGKGVKDIACGAYHNIVRHTDNTISCWGLNAMGQCNVPTTSSKGNLQDPSNANLKKIVGLHAGYSTTAVTFNDGTVVCWGDPAVANIVNQWTDIAMSPPNNAPEAGGRNEIDNYDSASPGYAKARFLAAYNSDAELETWNTQSDPMGYFHNFSENRHCSPMFDLGVETDPTLPMEYDPVTTSLGTNQLPVASEYSYIASGLPPAGLGVGAEYPFTDAIPNYIPSDPLNFDCDVLCITDPNGYLWQDFLGMKWRNSVFNAAVGQSEFSNPQGEFLNPRKSCCDLEIKTDFATAIRRTGQIITTRNSRGVSSCPANTYCRDCDADRTQSVTNGLMTNFAVNCPPPGAEGTFCNQHPPCGPGEDDPFCGQDFSLCGCCAPGVPSIYLGCPNCSSYTCTSDRIYSISGSDENPLSECAYFEGIGCISAVPSVETFYHNPNWADPTSGSLSTRWTSGLQVLYGHGADRPTANTASVAQNYGWTTIPAVDTVDDPRQTGTQECVNTHYPDEDLTCADICKSSGSWNPTGINPSGTPLWNYPEQMFVQGIQAGTNTVAWTQLGLAPTESVMQGGEGDTGPDEDEEGNPYASDCTGNCGQLDVICRDSRFWFREMPNTGELTFSCLYTGVNKLNASGSPSGPFVDKYNVWNPHRFGATSVSHCNAPPSVATTINYNMATKPWGPFEMAVWQGAGRENYNTYPNCHCCEPPQGQQIRPPGCAEVIANEFPTNQFLDPILGTYNGMPFEANMHCSGPLGGQTYPWCNASCLWFTQGALGQTNWAYLSPPFCAHYPTKSAASTRLAFAIVRADHRAYEDGNRMTPPGKCGEYPGGSLPNDPSQWIGCNPVTGNKDTSRDSEMMLHIWGSLWDPCPPWPRVCNCEMKLPLDESCVNPYGEDPENYQLDPEMPYASPCDSGGTLHPEGSPGPEAGSAGAFYPSWTKTPTGSARSSLAGAWDASGNWVQSEETETLGPATRYCPDCDEYEIQYRRDQFYAGG